MKDLSGKVAFITGGASGVGLGQAKVLAEDAGMKVVIADLQEPRLAEAMDYFHDRSVDVRPVQLDITDRAQYERAVCEIEDEVGPIHVLMNTAGISARGPVQEATYDDWDWHIDVNIKGVINGIKAILPGMIARGQGGHIVNTASISAFFPIATAALYTTSKYAVRGLSESLRLELEKFDIGVSCVCMAGVATNILDAEATRPARFGESGFQSVDPETRNQMKILLSAGIDAVDLAKITLTGMSRGDLWIFPYPEYVDRLDAAHRDLIASMNAWKDHPDYARRVALAQQAK